MTKINSLIISDSRTLIQKGSWSKKKYFRNLVVRRENPKQKDGITKLGDVMTKLPCGIVFKDETGMGATTVELNSRRNSIIVEPIKITASSKAFKFGNKVLYVGSPTENYHPNKIEDTEIYNYLQNSKIKFKKIIVVADSLGRVINAILDVSAFKALDDIEEEIKKMAALHEIKREEILENVDNIRTKASLKKYYNYSVLDNYFLLIDEIDSFQLDSSYRRSMEDCLDYYKMFKKTKRCMLSATDIRFTDPELQNEPITFIRYDIPTKRKIDIITSGYKQLVGKSFDRIVEKLKQHPDEKILVAYNSINGCFNLAENLRRISILKKEDIGILCSVQSKDRVGDYFKELDSDKLPKKVNFITSAYFTGFDLHEQFHLISISGNKNNNQALSERRLKQIAGRCRNGLLSETIIHDIIIGGTFRGANKRNTSAAKIFTEDNSSKKPIKKVNKPALKKEPTKEDLIRAATEQVRSLDCMNKHYKGNKMLHTILEDVNDKFMKLLDEKQMRFVRKDKDRRIKISYLNIDAKLESIRVRKELYMFDDSLTLRLKLDGHNVNSIERRKATDIVNSKVAQHGKDDKVREIIKKLKEVQKDEELDQYLENDTLDRIQRSIVWDFKRFYGYLDPINILEKMENNLIGQRDNRRYNSLLISAQIQTLPEGHIIIDRLKYYFEIGQKYIPQDILKRMTLLLLETGNTKKIKNEREAIKMLNNFRKTYRKVDEKDGNIYYHIQKDNPYNIVSKTKRLPLEQIQI